MKSFGFNDSSAVILFHSILLLSFSKVLGQDYEVADISCSFDDTDPNPNGKETEVLRAKLRKPEGFKGWPIFADDRQTDAQTDSVCQIRPDRSDREGLLYDLHVTDLSKCGIIVKNGFVNVRIWFPKLPGVVMMSDQEVIIMCKPAQSVITTNKAAGFAGKLPPAARVSGIVEESPGKLEYEVSLFREANSISFSPKSKLDPVANEIPVDQAVPIGTNLQLRASINTNSAWKYVKLVEVTISPRADDAYAKGYIKLIENGCRMEEFYTILPKQPYRPKGKTGEVRMEFEAVLLDAKKNSRANQLWIHARIKACVAETDCVPEFCLDLYQPKGAGKKRRRRRSDENLDGKSKGKVTKFSLVTKDHLVERENVRNFFPIKYNGTSNRPRRRQIRKKTASFGDNVGVTVIVPGEDLYFNPEKQLKKRRDEVESVEDDVSKSKTELDDCRTFLIVGGVLGSLLVVASAMMCLLSFKLFKLSRRYKKQKLDQVVREHRRKFGKPDDEIATSGLAKLHQRLDQTGRYPIQRS